MVWMKKIVEKVDGTEQEEDAARAAERERERLQREEEERQREEERRRREEERQREAEAAAELRRQQAAEAADRLRGSGEEYAGPNFERRDVREDERGAPVLDPQREALRSLSSDVPAYTMTIPEDEIRTSVTIPEDEIRFTPGGDEPAAPEPDIYQRVLDASSRYQSAPAPGGRSVDFAALDAQADAADVASRQQAEANLAPPPNAPAVPPQQAATPAAAPGVTTGPAPSSPLAPPVQPPAPQPLPEQQAAATAEQQSTRPAGSRIPQDVRTAAMPAPTAPLTGSPTATPEAAAPSMEDEARAALRRERVMRALAALSKLGFGIGGAVLAARGGSPEAVRVLGAAGSTLGNMFGSVRPTQDQARITQARQADLAQTRRGEELDLRAAAQRAQERRQAMLDAQGAQRLDLDARRVAAMEEGLGLRARQTEAQAAAAEALAAERASRGQRQTEEAAIEAARRDPGSELSRQAQRELRVTMQAVPEGERVPDDEIDMLSADAAEMLNSQFARRFGLRTRAAQRTGGGGGGGGGDRSGLGATASFREFAAREYPQLAQLSPEERAAAIDRLWSGLSTAERRAYISGSAMADTREDAEAVAAANAIPGWRLREGVPPPDTVKIRTAETLAASDRTMTRSLSTALRELEGIDVASRARSAVGWDTPETQRFRTAIDTAISEMTSYVNTGALNEADQARYERMFGSLTDLVSNDVIRSRLRTIRDELGAKARTRMESLGFQADTGGGGGVVRFRDANGDVYRLRDPRAISRARAAGWEEL